MKVFFYGLFMDENLLASKGIVASETSIGSVGGYSLRIGERATLVPNVDGRAHGVVIELAPGEVSELYAENSVADYVPEPVTVDLADGAQVEATCYNLPANKVSGTNREYAAALLSLATKLGFPEEYLAEIRRSG